MARDPTALPKKISCSQTPIVAALVGVGVGVGDAEVAVGEEVAVGVTGTTQPTSKDNANATLNTASAILFISVPPFCALLSSLQTPNRFCLMPYTTLVFSMQCGQEFRNQYLIQNIFFLFSSSILDQG
jgi:hypothetical protein